VEICLLATKGKPRRRASNIHQVIISHVEEHSKKPEEARRRIEVLTGDVPKIELFARRYSPGWDVWGNEVESDVVM
jgi:N6-adenosine-specific RNA methylase IME4